MVIEEQGLKILTDPGAFTTAQNEVKDIDIILITHEHGDHLHIDSVKQILQNNPQARIITNHGVGKILDQEKIGYELLEHGQSLEISGMEIEGHGEKHAEIYGDFGQVPNTGYFIGGRFFYPGDAFFNPKKPVEILALPVAGPWLKLSESINYAKELAPKKAFPVHDGMINQFGKFVPSMLTTILKPMGIEFVTPEQEQSMEF